MSNLWKNISWLVTLSFIFIFCAAFPSQPQEKVDWLLFSEIYLDEEEPKKGWVEVYNPTDTSLILERFRISHIKTINVLSDSIQQQGGIEVKPDEYLVLCTDKDLFYSVWGTRIKPVAVDALAMLAKGGFMAVTTKSSGSNIFDAFRYGDPAMSSYAEHFAGSQVLAFLKNGNSYSRKIVKTTTGINLSDFYETIPTPGLPNEGK